MTSDSPPRFAHESEAELARILDYYGVAWRYEPDVFPISWNADGAVVESFAPDFYLPEIDLYVELTTLKQSLVRKKNRKLRWMRQLYPEVRVKLFYARDFRALMVKYGRLDFLTDVNAANGAGNALTGGGNGNAAAPMSLHDDVEEILLDAETVARPRGRAGRAAVRRLRRARSGPGQRAQGRARLPGRPDARHGPAVQHRPHGGVVATARRPSRRARCAS